MAFTFSQTNLNNELETYDLAISINPDAAIINSNVNPGQTLAGTIAVANTGLVKAGVYLTADWGPNAGTSDREATLLANALTVSVYLSADPNPTQEYYGSFMGLIDQEVISSLNTTDDTEVYISITLPDTHSGPVLLGKSLNTDFVFVAVSVQ